MMPEHVSFIRGLRNAMLIAIPCWVAFIILMWGLVQ